MDHLSAELLLVGADTSIIFVVTNVLLQQTQVCHDKQVFVTTRHVACRDKKYAIHNKTFVATKIMFVATNTFLSQQKTYFVVKNTHLSQQDMFCHEKMIPVADPANNTE